MQHKLHTNSTTVLNKKTTDLTVLYSTSILYRKYLRSLYSSIYCTSDGARIQGIFSVADYSAARDIALERRGRIISNFHIAVVMP